MGLLALRPVCGPWVVMKCGLYCRAPGKEFRTARLKTSKLPRSFRKALLKGK